MSRLQSRRLSLTALGVADLPGMVWGNHLRLGFDARMGLPSCGFELFRRPAGQRRDESHVQFAALFGNGQPAVGRHGWDDGTVVVYRHQGFPQLLPDGSVAVDSEPLCFSFRASPAEPDVRVPVYRLGMSFVSGGGTVTVTAYDDRYDGTAFRRDPVALRSRSGAPGGVVNLDLQADLISTVEIVGPPGTRLTGLIYIELDDGGWEPWAPPWELDQWQANRPAVPMLLPLADPGGSGCVYPGCSNLDCAVEAEKLEDNLPPIRLEAGFVPRQSPDDPFAEYETFDQLLALALGPDPERIRLTEMRDAVRALLALPPEQHLHFEVPQPGAGGDSSIGLRPLALLLAGSVDADFARLIGLVTLDPEPGDGEAFDYKVEALWLGETHAWITHDVFPGRDGLLADPPPLAAAAVAAPGRPGTVKTNVELSWPVLPPEETLDSALQHVAYHLYRRLSGDPDSTERLTEDVDELAGMPAPRPLLAATSEPAPGHLQQPPAPGGHYTDRPPDYDTFDYGIQAIDLAGRRSKIVWTEEVKVPELVVPPPVSELAAWAIDTDHPQHAEQVEGRPAAVLAATGNAGLSGRALALELRFTAESQQVVGGTLRRIELHYRQGEHNQLPGLLGPATVLGAAPPQATSPVTARAILTCDQPVPAGLDDFAGERSRGTLAVGGAHFRVAAARPVGASTVEVDFHGRRDFLPAAGPASLVLGPQHSLYADPRSAATWHGFDTAWPPVDSAAGLALELDAATGAVVAPVPAGLDPNEIDAVRQNERRTDLPPGHYDWVYRLVVRGLAPPLPAGWTASYAAIAARPVADGGAGPFALPATVERRRYGPPPALDALTSDDFLWAGRPDFEGRIGVHLSWPAQPGVSRYRIHRIEAGELIELFGGDPAAFADLAGDAAARAQLRLWGGLRASAERYLLTTPLPVSPEVDPEDPGRRLWVDRFPAPRDGAYLYRVQPVSDAGGDAPWPADAADDESNRRRTVLVLQKPLAALLPVTVYALEPLDRALGLVLRRSPSPVVSGLRIYKTDDPAAARDPRRMIAKGGLIPLDHPRLESLPADPADDVPARLRLVDDTVVVGRTYYYRFVWEDDHGNRSPASEPMAASPLALSPPAPPTLSLDRVDATTVQLTWTADHAEGQVRVQRKPSGTGAWEDLNPDWLAPSDSFVDGDAAERYGYRLKLRDPLGRFVYTGVQVALTLSTT